MRIQHNIMAMNAYRNYSSNTNALGKNLEKLSSGYKINRAGDDAAGLAISEKMRAQITGLKTAQKNSKDGISLIQTAEGALTEVHSMLNRMVELADQSANGTYQNSPDRDNLQKEFSALRTEIDRISQASNFNGINLLDGTQAVTTTDTSQAVSITVPTAGTTAGSTIVHADGAVATKTEFSISLDGIAFDFNTTGTGNTIAINIAGTAYTATANFTASATSGQVRDAVLQALGGAGAAVTVNGMSFSVAVDGDAGIKFTMAATPTKAVTLQASMNGNFAVSITSAATAGALTGNLNFGTQKITEGVIPKDEILANTKFTLARADITDGSRLKIGNETYLFALSKETFDAADAASATTGFKVIDLTDLAEKNTQGEWQLKSAGGAVKEDVTARDRLTAAAKGNDMFTVGQNANGDITLQEKSTYTGNADLTTKEKIEEQISMKSGGEITTAGGLTLQIGESSATFNQLTVDIGKMDAASLNLSTIDIGTQLGAQNAVQTLQTAINTVSSTRGDLGALQNRLEHTINNLSVMTENIQDAEANIRDVDVAEEMMAYTKNNILVQSAQAMLAQANQVPQGVLQLLQ